MDRKSELVQLKLDINTSMGVLELNEIRWMNE